MHTTSTPVEHHAASARLNPDDVQWLNMQVGRRWLLDRLNGVMREVFADKYANFHGTAPSIMRSSADRLSIRHS